MRFARESVKLQFDNISRSAFRAPAGVNTGLKRKNTAIPIIFAPEYDVSKNCGLRHGATNPIAACPVLEPGAFRTPKGILEAHDSSAILAQNRL